MAHVTKCLPLENHAPSTAPGLNRIVGGHRSRYGCRGGGEDSILHIIFAGGRLHAEPEADIAAPRVFRIPQPALERHRRVPEPRGVSSVIRVIRAAAGKEERYRKTEAKARRELIGEVDILKVDLVHHLRALLHAVSLLDV